MPTIFKRDRSSRTHLKMNTGIKSTQTPRDTQRVSTFSARYPPPGRRACFERRCTREVEFHPLQPAIVCQAHHSTLVKCPASNHLKRLTFTDFKEELTSAPLQPAPETPQVSNMIHDTTIHTLLAPSNCLADECISCHSDEARATPVNAGPSIKPRPHNASSICKNNQYVLLWGTQGITDSCCHTSDRIAKHLRGGSKLP